MIRTVADESGQRSVQSVEVGGQLLLALADSRTALSLKDLAGRAGLTSARAHPYLVSFGRLGLVVQDGKGRYALGPAALHIGLSCLAQLDPVQVAMPVAAQLAEDTGYAVALALWGNFGPTIIRMIDARQPLLVSMRAGTVMSILGTATGRAFAAVLPESRLLQAMTGPLGEEPCRRPLALTDAERVVLDQAREDVRLHGVVRAQGRPIPSVNAFSAPALDHEGQPAIVITALGHQDEFPVAWDSAAAVAVRAAARHIAVGLGAGLTQNI